MAGKGAACESCMSLRFGALLSTALALTPPSWQLATGELLDSGFTKATSDFKDAPWVELALASKRYPMAPVVNAEKVHFFGHARRRNGMLTVVAPSQKSPPTHEAFSRAQTRAQDLIRDFRLALAGYHPGRDGGVGVGNAGTSQ